MSGAHITYTPRPDSTPEAERFALSAVYSFILAYRASKEAAPESRPDDERNDHHALTYPNST